MFERFTAFRGKKSPTRTTRAGAKVTAASDRVSPSVDERTAQAAAAVLENDAFNRVYDRIRAARLATFAQSKAGAEGALDREGAHLGLVTLDKIREDIQAMADDLKLHRKKDAD